MEEEEEERRTKEGERGKLMSMLFMHNLLNCEFKIQCKGKIRNKAAAM